MSSRLRLRRNRADGGVEMGAGAAASQQSEEQPGSEQRQTQQSAANLHPQESDSLLRAGDEEDSNSADGRHARTPRHWEEEPNADVQHRHHDLDHVDEPHADEHTPLQPAPSRAAHAAAIASARADEGKQDQYGQRRRIKYAQDTFLSPFWCCIPALLVSARAGYLLSTFKRRGDFDAQHQGLNLSQIQAKHQLGMSIQVLNTVKSHIVGLVKPLIRVHVLDLETGYPLQSPTFPAVRPKLSNAFRPSDSLGKLIWQQDIVFQVPFSATVSDNALYLFEIIDDRPSLSLKASRAKHGRMSIYKKVAWGFLLPVGIDGHLNVGLPVATAEPGDATDSAAPGEATATSLALQLPLPSKDFASKAAKSSGRDANVRVQLYDYRHYDGLVGAIQRQALQWPELDPQYTTLEDDNFASQIPPIYLQWKIVQKKPIDGAHLLVSLGPRNVQSTRSGDGEEDASDASSGRLSPTAKTTGQKAASFSGARRRLKNKDDRLKMKTAALRRTRGPRDGCFIPDRFLYRLEVGPEGAMTVAFSNSGHLLAVASRMALPSQSGYIYSLLLYDTDVDEEIWAEEVAHHAVIYELRWSKNDRYLLSCSADGTCKVWDLLALHPLMSLYPGPPPGSETARSTASEATSNVLKPSRLQRSHPPHPIQTMSLSTGVYAYTGLFQEFGQPYSLQPSIPGYTAGSHLPVASLDARHWQEQMQEIINSTIPRVIIGTSDGRIRVFEHGDFLGFISVAAEVDGGIDYSPHDGAVHSLVLDERTKYLISADSVGDILIWRQEASAPKNATGSAPTAGATPAAPAGGWYSLLRKVRRDFGAATGKGPTTAASASAAASARNADVFRDGSILSLSIHPDKMKGLLLVMSRQPATLKVLNLATYRPFHACENFKGLSAFLVREGETVYSSGVFHRASFSADGKYIICCCNVSHDSDKPLYRLLVWDSYTGEQTQTALSSLSFPYPVRCVAWHPTQHLIAVATLGPGAAVVVYCTDSNHQTAQQQQQQQQQQGQPSGPDPSLSMSLTGGLPRLDQSVTGLMLDRPAMDATGRSSPNLRASGSSESFSLSLLNNSAFVHLRGDGSQQNPSSLGTLSGHQFGQSVDVTRSNDSVPNFGTVQLGPPRRFADAVSALASSGASRSIPSTGSAAAQGEGSGRSTPVSDAEARVAKMAKAREILARARAQKAAAASTSTPPGSDAK